VVDRAGRRRGGRAAARAALAVALAALAVGAAAWPAKAHDIGRAEATSYQTRILRVEPPSAASPCAQSTPDSGWS
jgi:hypothetical protein